MKIPYNNEKFAIVGSDCSLSFANSKKEAKEVIAATISDMVYENLGGDDEFLYNEEGEILPDEEILDSVNEILALGEENYVCYKTDNGLWAYASEDDPAENLEFEIHELVK